MRAKIDDSERPSLPLARHAGRPTFHVVTLSVMGTKRARRHEISSVENDTIGRVFDLLGAGSVPRTHSIHEVSLSHAAKLPQQNGKVVIPRLLSMTQ
jgi:hypothetical protein